MASELCGAGLTTAQVGQLFEKFYGPAYGKSTVSRMFDDARSVVKAWLRRPLDPYYPILYIDATFIATRRGDCVSKKTYYTILGIKDDRTPEVLAIVNLPIESAAGWRCNDTFAELVMWPGAGVLASAKYRSWIMKKVLDGQNKIFSLWLGGLPAQGNQRKQLTSSIKMH